MTKIFSLLFLSFFLISCNKSGDNPQDCTSSVQAEEGASSTDCTIVDEPVTGTTTGGTVTGGTSTGGATTGGTTTGGTTTGGTTTGGTSGGTTTGGTSGGALPNAAYTFDHNVSFYKTTVTQESKFIKALDIIKRVVATEKFRTKILGHTYNGSKTFVDNGGFTNAQIYQKILDGAETLQKIVDNEMDMEVEVYYAATSTVGYTYANSKRVWVNTKFFNSYDATGVARNLFHEWLHKLGFTHSSSYNSARPYSVPYAIGDIVGDLGREFL